MLLTNPSWYTLNFFRTVPRRPKSLLVIINPASGKGTAEQVYKKHGAPIFELCGIKTDVQGEFLDLSTHLGTKGIKYDSLGYFLKPSYSPVVNFWFVSFCV